MPTAETRSRCTLHPLARARPELQIPELLPAAEHQLRSNPVTIFYYVPQAIRI